MSGFCRNSNRVRASVVKGFALFFVFLFSASLYANPPLYQVFAEKTQTVRQARQELQGILKLVTSRPDLFPAQKLPKKKFSSREQRLMIWHTWHNFLQNILILDEVERDLSNLQGYNSEQAKETGFRIRFAAFLAEYRFSMDFIERMENDPGMHITLNEAVAEMQMPADTYSRLKFRFLNISRGMEFARLNSLYHLYGKDHQLSLTQGMDADIKAIWNAGKGRGPKQTLKNAVRISKDAGFDAWFPLQKNVSEWMGDVKVRRHGRSLINSQQINYLQTKLQPGDILLERHEWYLSNVGLPGYWSHAALYIGTPEERRAYFHDLDKDLFNGQGKHFESYLQQHFPRAYAASIQRQQDGHLPRVIEAISEGVSLTTLQYTADADSIAILRPRLNKAEKARAIAQAFFYQGRPYDFNFDFLTDAELVCTELIYKAYEPDSHHRGLRLPLLDVLGRKATPANEFAHLYDTEQGTATQQFDLIAFLDGHERKNKAVIATEAEFRQSWKRPKWYVLVQDTALQSQQKPKKTTAP
ncbi:MAG: hypothetical protein KZQ58_03735 [gamma proteobacterium symbiont of Bathyaustriella thionipta]|nr:hypothetical protein [gamma proteobacterium symbiont of Bathyaustriella thionipta]